MKMESNEGRALTLRFQREEARDKHVCGCPKEHFSTCPLSPLYCLGCFGDRFTWEDDETPAGASRVPCERCASLYGEAV